MASPSVQSVLSQHQYPPIPPSPARSFASTAYPTASLNIPPPPPPPIPGHFLSSNDVKASISAYETLSEAAKTFRKSLSQVAGAAAAFGAALETCARCKGAGDTGDGLMGGSGLQYLIASNMHLLSDAIYRGFEVPILHELDSYKEKTAENEASYKKEANEKSKELRKREAQHLKLARQKRRNLTSFREALLDLTSKIDDLENLKYSHYRTSLTHSQEASQRILDCSAIVVRAEVEIFEKIASKGWDASGGLDDLITRAADPFAAPISNSGEGEIFSILPTESILPSPHQGVVSRSGSISGVGGGGGGLLMEGKYRSLAGTITHNDDPDGDDGEEGDYEDGDEYNQEAEDRNDTHSLFSGRFPNDPTTNSGIKRKPGNLPLFSPSTASSAGWGNVSVNADDHAYGIGMEAQLRDAAKTPTEMKKTEAATGGREWRDSESDGSDAASNDSSSDSSGEGEGETITLREREQVAA